MASSHRKQLHAVAIPLPGQGHINPMMRFCKTLASRHDFTITFVDIQPFVNSDELLSKQELQQQHANPEELSKQLQEHTRASPQKLNNIRRVHIPMEILKVGTVFESFLGALQSLAPLIEELLSKLIHEDPPITCLISDLFMTGPTQTLADQFHIPRIALHTCNQSTLLFKNYILEGTISLEQGRRKRCREVFHLWHQQQAQRHIQLQRNLLIAEHFWSSKPAEEEAFLALRFWAHKRLILSLKKAVDVRHTISILIKKRNHQRLLASLFNRSRFITIERMNVYSLASNLPAVHFGMHVHPSHAKVSCLKSFYDWFLLSQI